MGTIRRIFTEKYKAEAVSFVLDGGRSIAEVARNIGCHERNFGKWVQKARESRESAVEADAPLNESERMDLIRLRAELKDSQAENDELLMRVEFAKVATWFAKESQ